MFVFKTSWQISLGRQSPTYVSFICAHIFDAVLFSHFFLSKCALNSDFIHAAFPVRLSTFFLSIVWLWHCRHKLFWNVVYRQTKSKLPFKNALLFICQVLVLYFVFPTEPGLRTVSGKTNNTTKQWPQNPKDTFYKLKWMELPSLPQISVP